MVTVSIGDLVYNAVLLVSAVVYLLLMICLHRRRHELKSSFFCICVHLGVSDLCRVFITIVVLNPVQVFGLQQQVVHSTWNQLHALADFIVYYYLFYVNVCGLLLLTINRLTAIARPLQYKQLWTSTRLCLGASLTWLLPLPVLGSQLIPACQPYYPLNASNSMAFRPYSRKFECLEWITMGAGCVDVVFTVLLLLLHLHMVCTACSHTKEQSDANQSKRAEIRPAFIGLVLTLTYVQLQLVVIVYVFFPSTVESMGDHFWFYWNRVFSDALNVSNVYLLLLFSTSARRHFVAFLTGQATASDKANPAHVNAGQRCK